MTDYMMIQKEDAIFYVKKLLELISKADNDKENKVIWFSVEKLSDIFYPLPYETVNNIFQHALHYRVDGVTCKTTQSGRFLYGFKK